MEHTLPEAVKRRLANRGLAVTAIELIAERNHVIWRAETPDGPRCVRAINESSHRKREWISMREEYRVLQALESKGASVLDHIPRPWPKVYEVDESECPALLVHEWVDAVCVNTLKPLTEEHLRAVARAIAKLNTVAITSRDLPFVERPREFPGASRAKWALRLAEACIRSRMRKDVVEWARTLWELCGEVSTVLADQRSLVDQSPRYFFHFDGAHSGNTYLRDNHVVFLDWQKVSFRRDPTFTLVRFGVSVDEEGQAPLSVLDTLAEAYCDTVGTAIDRTWFQKLARARWLERETSDAVWVLREPFRKQHHREVPPIEEDSGVAARCRRITELVDDIF